MVDLSLGLKVISGPGDLDTRPLMIQRAFDVWVDPGMRDALRQRTRPEFDLSVQLYVVNREQFYGTVIIFRHPKTPDRRTHGCKFHISTSHARGAREDPSWTPLPQPYSTALPSPVAFRRQSFHFDIEDTGPACTLVGPYTQKQNSTPLEGPWTPLPVKRHRGEPGHKRDTHGTHGRTRAHGSGGYESRFHVQISGNNDTPAYPVPVHRDSSLCASQHAHLDYHISRRTRHELQAHHGHVALLNRPRADRV